jgi:hypothetical protein
LIAMFRLALLVGAAATHFYVPLLSPPTAVQRPGQPGAATIPSDWIVPEPMPAAAPVSMPKFFVMIAAGLAFIATALAQRSQVRKPALAASFAMAPALSSVANVAKRTRAGGPPRMATGGDGDGLSDLVRGSVEQVMRYMETAYVVVFNSGTPQEGVYTLETSQGQTKGELLTFERTEDAAKFCRELQGNDFEVVGDKQSVSLQAQALPWATGRISEFCSTGDFAVAFVPAGGRISPPGKNMYDPARFDANRPEDRFDNMYNNGFDQNFDPRGLTFDGQRPDLSRHAQPQANSAPALGFGGALEAQPEVDYRMNFPGFDQSQGFEGGMPPPGFGRPGKEEMDQRRRAQDILNNANRTSGQKRGQSVWDNAMRKSQGRPGAQGQPGAPPGAHGLRPGDLDLTPYEEGPPQYVCGPNEELCAVDELLEERDMFDEAWTRSHPEERAREMMEEKREKTEKVLKKEKKKKKPKNVEDTWVLRDGALVNETKEKRKEKKAKRNKGYPESF